MPQLLGEDEARLNAKQHLTHRMENKEVTQTVIRNNSEQSGKIQNVFGFVNSS